ncbi:hypothetical protein SEUCBS139899_009214 [Sporothrix eucalyptigena]|uniref:L-dopachrome isomerase n=1 Tax=Sporothrix eucalyptigena TaxID=1812306 RepID=A0ABP0BZG6_9PEZI
MATATDVPVQTRKNPQMKTQAQSQAQRPRPLPSIQDAGKWTAATVAANSHSHRSNSNGSSSNNSYGTASSHGKIKMTTRDGHSMQAHHGSTNSNGSSVELGIGGVDDDDNGGTALSFSQRATQLARSPTPLLVKGDRHLLRDIDRPAPGDPSTQLRSGRRSSLFLGDVPATTANASAAHRGDIARKRSQYFEDAFSSRDADTSPAKERVRSEALVLAEIRTNVIIGDEFTVVTELSAHLALRYRRPLSSIVVTLQHGACMCFGGSFAPAYVMTVCALPAQLQPATNKRNAALIQRHMEETLGVPAARGHLQFVAVPEANLAYGGKTAVGHADDLAKASNGSANTNGGGANANGMYRSPSGSAGSPNGTAVENNLSNGSSSRKHKTTRKLSVKSLSSFRAPSPPELTPPPSAVDEHPPTIPGSLPAIPERLNKDEGSVNEGDKNKTKKASPPSKKIAGKDIQEKQKAPGQVPLAVQLLQSPPTSPVAVGRQPSRRARRTKSFVANWFGRSATKPEESLA